MNSNGFQAIVVDEQGARLVRIPKTLHAYQDCVGGYIETWPHGRRNPTVYVNEEGMIKGLPVFAMLDCHTVYGPILAVIESRDMTEKDLQSFKRRLAFVGSPRS